MFIKSVGVRSRLTGERGEILIIATNRNINLDICAGEIGQVTVSDV